MSTRIARRLRRQRGQNTIEFAVVVAAVVMAILFGSIFFRRALYGRWKETADQAGTHFAVSNTQFTIETVQESGRNETSGNFTEMNTNRVYSRSTIVGNTVFDKEFVDAVGGVRQYTGHEVTQTAYVKQNELSPNVGEYGTANFGDLRGGRIFDE